MTTLLEWDEGSAARTGRTLPPEKNRYPLYRRLGWSQGRSGQVRKISSPPGFDDRTVQPVVSRYTDWAPGHTVPYRQADKLQIDGDCFGVQDIRDRFVTQVETSPRTNMLPPIYGVQICSNTPPSYVTPKIPRTHQEFVPSTMAATQPPYWTTTHLERMYEIVSNENLKYFFLIFCHGRYGVLIRDSCPDVRAIPFTVTRRFSFTIAPTAAMPSGCHYWVCLTRSRTVCYRTDAVHELPSPLVHLLYWQTCIALLKFHWSMNFDWFHPFTT